MCDIFAVCILMVASTFVTLQAFLKTIFMYFVGLFVCRGVGNQMYGQK